MGLFGGALKGLSKFRNVVNTVKSVVPKRMYTLPHATSAPASVGGPMAGPRLNPRTGRPYRHHRRGLTPSRLAKIMMLQAVLGKSSPAVKIAGLKLIGGRI